jgi:hypothetical protein
MPGTVMPIGPFLKGLHNSAGTGEYIADDELFDLVNLEVDSDGSLANRPAVNSIVPTGFTGRFKVIGTFFPAGGAKYLVISYGSGFGTTGLLSLSTFSITASRAIKSNVAAQYNNLLFVVPSSDSAAGTGGYWSGASTPAWTAATRMPNGDDACVFNDRLWITAGLSAVAANDSYVWYSCLLHPEIWIGDTGPGGGASPNDAGFITTESGNGQRTVSILVMNNDLVIFKEHSTFRFNYSTDPAKGGITKISSTIGTPTNRCAVSFDNNNVYVLHDTSVYELYNYTYTKISTVLSMIPVIDNNIYSDSQYGLAIFQNRLFVRYYGREYVFSLQTGRWSRWVSTSQFSALFIVPNFQGTYAAAFGHSISSVNPLQLNYILDHRVTGVGTNESFNCSIITKTYDFSLPWAYKVLFWWGMAISTSGTTTVSAQIPSSTTNYTWNGLAAKFGTWQGVNSANTPWSNNAPTIINSVVPPERGAYAKKFLKFNKKLRFRQVIFNISTPAISNTIGDACVRIYDISAFVLQRQTVVARTT